MAEGAFEDITKDQNQADILSEKIEENI